MKIIRLTAENIKRLYAVEITPDGSTVVVAGRNGQGKTSVLDAIWFALAGGPALKETSRPIRDGAEQATVTLDLGELVVTRTWKGDKTTLKVESADGARYTSPQQMLDTLVGKLSFDPLAFAQLDARSQVAQLASVIGFDVAAHDAKRRTLFDERTMVGREVRALSAQVEAMAQPLPGLADQTPESASSIILKISAGERAKFQAEQATRVIQQWEVRVGELRDKLRDAEIALEQARSAELPTVPDLNELNEQLAHVEERNAAITNARIYAARAADLAGAEARQTALTLELKRLDEEKTKAVTGADLPVQGLALEEDGVTYNGVPFKQCSAAEQLRVSLAVAMSLNPTIRVIRITDGSLLDAQNMALIAQMAQSEDFQIWVERVDETGAVGVIIEDGRVKTQ